MRVFVDTAPFIYLIEKHPEFVDSIKRYFTELYTEEAELLTSVITLSEFGVGPNKKGKPELVQQFEEFIEKIGIKMVNVNRDHAKLSSKLRSKYQFLKGMDSLQIAMAQLENCDHFLTNDIKLSKIREIKVVLVKDLG